LNSSRAGHRGFSLVEMLVVLLVVVLLTSLVTININSGASDRVVQEKIEDLAAVAAYALNEAQFQGVDFGVLFVNEPKDNGEVVLTAYWRHRLPVGWRPADQLDPLFEPIEFPPDVEFALFLEGVEVFAETAQAAAVLSGRVPQWLLLASGETQAGEIAIRDGRDGELLWRLDWDGLARFDSRGPNDRESLAFGETDLGR